MLPITQISKKVYSYQKQTSFWWKNAQNVPYHDAEGGRESACVSEMREREKVRV